MTQKKTSPKNKIEIYGNVIEIQDPNKNNKIVAKSSVIKNIVEEYHKSNHIGIPQVWDKLVILMALDEKTARVISLADKDELNSSLACLLYAYKANNMNLIIDDYTVLMPVNSENDMDDDEDKEENEQSSENLSTMNDFSMDYI